jgi:outer membrane usher protein
MQFGAQASKSIKQEEGSYGWRVADLEGGSQTRSASVVYRSGVAQVEGGVVQAGRSAQGAVSVDGSIALAGGDVFLSPRIHDSFAVVDVGAPNVPIEYENRKVATTGSGGRAIVPDLRSFQRNKIAIDPTNLPINASIASTKETIVPADHGVAVVNFGVQASVAGAVVKLVDATGKPLKTGLAGKLADGKEFVVGYDGKAYIEGLSASNAATIDLDPGACQAEFEYKANADEQVVIGPIACR